jgi:hypothetical protein
MGTTKTQVRKFTAWASLVGLQGKGPLEVLRGAGRVLHVQFKEIVNNGVESIQLA